MFEEKCPNCAIYGEMCSCRFCEKCGKLKGFITKKCYCEEDCEACQKKDGRMHTCNKYRGI